MLGWSWQYKLIEIENRVVYRLARVGVWWWWGLQQQQPGYLSSGQRAQEAERINCKLSDGEMAGRELSGHTDWTLILLRWWTCLLNFGGGVAFLWLFIAACLCSLSIASRLKAVTYSYPRIIILISHYDPSYLTETSSNDMNCFNRV